MARPNRWLRRLPAFSRPPSPRESRKSREVTRAPEKNAQACCKKNAESSSEREYRKVQPDRIQPRQIFRRQRKQCVHSPSSSQHSSETAHSAEQGTLDQELANQS